MIEWRKKGVKDKSKGKEYLEKSGEAK